MRPRRVVHDLHPDYASTRYAVERAAKEGVALVAVQHHHAHMASCMAENGLDGPAIGVTFDGTGLGTDGTIWGGEFLVGDPRGFRRAAHLRRVGMPGAAQAVREPWRMALAHLLDAALSPAPLEGRVPARALAAAERAVERRFHCPWTSSAGRLFDAVASLAGGRVRASFQGQAAMELEWLASGLRPDRAYPFALVESGTAEGAIEVDTRPLIRAAAEEAGGGEEARRIARRFHSTLVEVIAQVCRRIREAEGIDAVVLSGGVFLNALLSLEVSEELRARGFQVYRHRLVPPNDGGLSLGQLAVAAAQGRD
jgi:hydrogenase maturation protein HypF